MKKVFIVTVFFTAFHFVEDMLWLTLGRYTEIPYWFIVLAIIGLGITGGLIVRHPKVKEFLGK